MVDFAKTESEITSRWSDLGQPLVSVVCTTFNHGKYIEEALHGFLMQDTNFAFEIIVHDDVSTDDTREIVSRYVAKYPHIIKPVFQTQNQYSLGRTSAIIAFGYCQGEYIAFCEGDDYWTDPTKLQLQVDLLRSDPSLSLVFHNARLLHEAKGNALGEIACKLPKTSFDLADVVIDGWFIPSHSMVFKRAALPLPEWLHRVFGLDYAMHLLLATEGKIGYIDRIMGVYRINSASVSGNRPPGFFQVKHIQTLSYFNIYTNFLHDKLVTQRLGLEREALYLAYLNGRAWYVRVLSADYYRFKFNNFWRRQQRRFVG